MNISTKNISKLLKINFSLVFVFLILTSNAQEFKIYAGADIKGDSLHITKGDTVNIKDKAGLKQGLWYYADRKTKKIKSLGYYKNNKRVGLWYKFYPDGSKLSEFHYQKGQKIGKAKTYYANGKLQEEGFWKVNTWLGEYKFYFENGNLCYLWYYDKEGNRTGEQKYFHENGKIKIKGNWKKGNRDGVLKEYYEDGTLRTEMKFSGDKMDSTSVKNYKKAEKRDKPDVVTVNTETQKLNNGNTNVIKNPNEHKTNHYKTGKFQPNGYNKLLNSKNQKVEKEGLFRGGELYTGKWFIYDEKGKLIRELELKEGKRIKDIKY